MLQLMCSSLAQSHSMCAQLLITSCQDMAHSLQEILYHTDTQYQLQSMARHDMSVCNRHYQVMQNGRRQDLLVTVGDIRSESPR